ncbi:MAG TPA: hypothetical protein VGI19_06085 [Candidatus Cybelea sp.]|jgi:hypothetical protein
MIVKLNARCLVGVAVALASALGGCSANAGSGDASFIPSQTPQTLARTDTGQDLLYVSEYGGGVVDIFSYPQNAFLGSL